MVSILYENQHLNIVPRTGNWPDLITDPILRMKEHTKKGEKKYRLNLHTLRKPKKKKNPRKKLQ